MPQALPAEDEKRNLTRALCGDQIVFSGGTDNLKWLGENKLVSGQDQKARAKSPMPWAVLAFAELIIKAPQAVENVFLVHTHSKCAYHSLSC